MSAIRMTCARCKAVYLAGMVGSTPWAPHVCADIQQAQQEAEEALVAASAEQGTLDGAMR